MTRPLRLEFPGSLWHVTSRGNEQRLIVVDDADRRLLLDLFGEAVDRFAWIVHQYVLMSNHFHLVFQLRENTLSRGMHWLNSRYAQAFNRRHARVGHLFQGRFHARLVEKEAYLLEVLRYVALNPVRAGMVRLPEQYPWSGHRALAGLAQAPAWHAVDHTLRLFAPDPDEARAFYTRFVDDGIALQRCPWRDVVGQIYLGTPAWAEEVQRRVHEQPRSDDHPLAQRELLASTMSQVIASVAAGLATNENLIRFGRGGEARMLAAWLGCHEARLELRSIAAALRVRSAGGISKLIRCCDQRLQADPRLRAAVERCTEVLRGVSKVKSEGLTLI